MNELLKIDQNVTIVPEDFNFTNKGAVTEVSAKGFRMKMKYPTKGIETLKSCEFYSHTPNGILFFNSQASEISENELFIENPKKHRFLQRRQFTRVKFITETTMTDTKGKEFNINTQDLSAGGMRFVAYEALDLDETYKINLQLNDDQFVCCFFQPIRMERKEIGVQLSGRFVNQTNVDKMTLIQYCMNRNMEDKNK